MSTVVEGDFEWDSDKAASNLAKHGISFPEATTVFADPFAVYLDDGSGTRWWSLAHRCATGFCTWCTLSAARAIALSALGRPRVANGMSTKQEVSHEPGNQATS